MTDPDVPFLLVGLPDSGKSTYLAAVFHTLKVGASDVLRLRDLPEERDYLIELEERWLSLQPVGHSAHSTPRRIELPISSGRWGDLVLTIPDVTGENFTDAWETGHWSPDIQALVDNAAGMLIFVRADDVETAALIEVGNQPAIPLAGAKAVPWHPRLAPTQARLCDLLEQLVTLRGGELPPMAVVVSAWDTVDEDLSPTEWLAWRVPLISQWLRANSDQMRHEVFAVSAQGDSLDAEGRQRLAAVPRVERGGGAETLLRPLQWLLEMQ